MAASPVIAGAAPITGSLCACGCGLPARPRRRYVRGHQPRRPRGPASLAVVSLRQSRPCDTLAEIGSRVGLTKERVRQILAREGLPTRAYSTRVMFACSICGLPCPPRPLVSYPSATGDRAVFCSPECKRDYHRPQVACEMCGKLFRRHKSLLVRKSKDPRYTTRANYCSRRCFGHVIGALYGVRGLAKAHIAQTERAEARRLMVWQRHLETGWGCRRLGMDMGINETTVSGYLWQMRKRTRQEGDVIS